MAYYRINHIETDEDMGVTELCSVCADDFDDSHDNCEIFFWEPQTEAGTCDHCGCKIAKEDN